MNLTVHGIGRLSTMGGAPLVAAAPVVRDGRVAWTGVGGAAVTSTVVGGEVRWTS